jgi:hypothetical protein
MEGFNFGIKGLILSCELDSEAQGLLKGRNLLPS